MITSYAQQVVSTFLRLVHVTSRVLQSDASSCSVANNGATPTDHPTIGVDLADPMLRAFATLQGSYEPESVDEARRMLMSEYVKQLAAANNKGSRLTFWRRKRATPESLGRKTALAAYKQTKLYAEKLVADRLI